MLVQLPARCSHCSCGKEPLLSGLTYVSYMNDNQREDFCLVCWEKIQKEKKTLEGSYWKAKVAPKKQKVLSKDEKALAFFQQEYESENHQLLYVLALYLERRKQLIKKSDSKGKVSFEAVSTGELFQVKKVAVTQEAIDKILTILDES